MALRVLVTGANGFIGGHVTRALVVGGHGVLGVALESEPAWTHPSLAYRQLDITDDVATKRLLQEDPVDAVFHLAALVHVRDPNLTFVDYARVNYRASESLFSAALGVGVKRLVFASTVEVYGPTANGAVVNEEAPCRPDSDYARTKLLAEQSLCNLCSPQGVAYAILRFAPVYAPGFRLNLDKRLYLAAPNLSYRIGAGNYSLSLCSLRNIEHWVLRWLSQPAAVSGIFNLADARSYGVQELLRLERAHSRAKVTVALPTVPCLATLALREMVLTARGRSAGMYSTANFRKLARSVCWDSRKAQLAVGGLPGDLARDLYNADTPAGSSAVDAQNGSSSPLPAPRIDRYDRAKRFLDLSVAVTALAGLALPLIGIAVAIRVTSRVQPSTGRGALVKTTVSSTCQNFARCEWTRRNCLLTS